MKLFFHLLILLIPPTFISCSGFKNKITGNWIKTPAEREKDAREELQRRVVYTPLLPSRQSTDASKLEVLLRTPEKKFRELGLISMYRRYGNESAADFMPYLRERAAKEGADAILLTEIDEKPIAVTSSAAAFPVGNVTFANATTGYVKEGTIRGIAIVYVE